MTSGGRASSDLYKWLLNTDTSDFDASGISFIRLTFNSRNSSWRSPRATTSFRSPDVPNNLQPFLVISNGDRKFSIIAAAKTPQNDLLDAETKLP